MYIHVPQIVNARIYTCPADFGPVNAEAKKRGRPPLSAEERGQRAALKREREEEEERLKAMPQHLQQLAKSAKGHGKLDAFLTKK
mmetsp:Transcript_2581/g.2834  ORF Transcript_2581/g.2834 Transcript_2581/m.2834 type:complete len:85 (-) Transcript_2581:178-432(-)